MGSILIIDPNPEVRSLVADILARAGHTVKEAAHVPQALTLLGGGDTDLVVTDLVMFRSGGTSAVAAIRRHFPSIEIVALSSAPQSTGYLRLAATLGERRTLAKPFMNRKVLELLNEMLAGVGAYTAHIVYQSSRQGMAGRN